MLSMGFSLCSSEAMKSKITEFRPDFKPGARIRGKIRVVKVSYVSVLDASQRLSRAVAMLLNELTTRNEDKHPDNRGGDRKA